MATTSRYELDFVQFFRQCEEGKITVSQLAAVIARRLNDLAGWARITGQEQDATDVEALWENFDFIAGDSTATMDELDDALERLYDWADNPGEFDSEGVPLHGMILCRVRSTLPSNG